MKHLILTLILSFTFCTNIVAQRYTIFAIKGKAYIIKNNNQCELTLGESISTESNIVIPEKNAILLLDSKKKKKLPMISGPQKGELQKIFKKKAEVTFIKCIIEVYNYISGKNSSDFGSETEKGHFTINASSQRSLNYQEEEQLNELDKGVMQIMEQFYLDSSNKKE